MQFKLLFYFIEMVLVIFASSFRKFENDYTFLGLARFSISPVLHAAFTIPADLSLVLST